MASLGRKMVIYTSGIYKDSADFQRARGPRVRVNLSTARQERKKDSSSLVFDTIVPTNTPSIFAVALRSIFCSKRWIVFHMKFAE